MAHTFRNAGGLMKSFFSRIGIKVVKSTLKYKALCEIYFCCTFIGFACHDQGNLFCNNQIVKRERPVVTCIKGAGKFFGISVLRK
jgi:hypothetical protein